MIGKNTISRREGEMRASQLNRLYYWLSYHRFSIVLYGALYCLPWLLVFLAVVILALVFAPYMLYVLYKNGKRGWLVTFAAVVGVPIVLAFIPTGSRFFGIFLDFMPLLAFYFYCYLLRFSVGEWISDASQAAEEWVTEEEKQDESFNSNFPNILP